MANSLQQRMHAVVDLLIGMRLIPVREALAPKGFSEGTLKHGWSLLEQVGLTLGAGTGSILGLHADAMDAFQKEWFPLVRSIFGRARPGLVVRLLGRLRLEGRREAAYLVPPFLLALRELEASEFEDERDAFAHLQSRGLTESVIRAAEEHVRAFTRPDRSIPYSTLPTVEERAVNELWDFYLEWSAICRQRIKNKNWLRSLGLTAETRGRRRPSHDISLNVVVRARSAARASEAAGVAELRTAGLPTAELGTPARTSKEDRKKLLNAATARGKGRRDS